jgi:hypothetical protein
MIVAEYSITNEGALERESVIRHGGSVVAQKMSVVTNLYSCCADWRESGDTNQVMTVRQE